MRSAAIRASLVSTLVVLLVGFTYAQTSGPARAADNEQQIRAAMGRLLDASQRGDKDAAGRLLADDLTWVGGNGHVMSKSDLLQQAPAMPPERITVEQIWPLSNTAVTVGVAHFSSGNQARFVQHWIKDRGEWRIIAHQSAPIAALSTAATSGLTRTAPSSTDVSRAIPASVAPTLNSRGERTVWKTQELIQRAFLHGDTATYAKLTADDFVRVADDGTRFGKLEYMSYVRRNAKLRGGQIQSSDVRITINNGTARLVMTTSGVLPDGSDMPPTRVTKIFRRNTVGDWQQVAAVFTRIVE